MHDLCVHMTVCVCLHTRVALLSCVCVVAVFSRRTHTPRHTHTASTTHLYYCTTPIGECRFPRRRDSDRHPTPHTVMVTAVQFLIDYLGCRYSSVKISAHPARSSRP